jgi:hypothetical protein
LLLAENWIRSGSLWVGWVNWQLISLFLCVGADDSTAW